MGDNFTAGEADADTQAPPVETIGAHYGISVSNPGRGAHEPQQEPYLMPSVHGRNGSTERVDPAITQTPLGGLMPGPNAIAPAVVVGTDYRAPDHGDVGGFDSGVIDGFPEGCPVPY